MGAAAAIGLGGGALGALTGAQGSNKNTTSSTTSGVMLGPESSQAIDDQNAAQEGLGLYRDYANYGPNEKDVIASTDAQRDLAGQLQQYSQGGYLPNQADINNANNIAGNLFQAQHVGLDQAFTDQTIAANRQAALMGRDPNDPILAAKLATEKSRQLNMLNAQQGGFAQQLALSMPMQRLDFAQQRANFMGGLATQAMANRQALASMGQTMLNNQRNWQYLGAQRYSNGNSNEHSGGGLAGGILGGLGGFSNFANSAPALMKMFSGTGGNGYDQGGSSSSTLGGGTITDGGSGYNLGGSGSGGYNTGISGGSDASGVA